MDVDIKVLSETVDKEITSLSCACQMRNIGPIRKSTIEMTPDEKPATIEFPFEQRLL